MRLFFVTLAAAAVGPITLNMAGLVHPGTTYLPFMAMSTAIASSFAYCLIIGTPPNAIVFGSGMITIPQMARAGLVMNLLGIVLLSLVALFLAPQLL